MERRDFLSNGLSGVVATGLGCFAGGARGATATEGEDLRVALYRDGKLLHVEHMADPRLSFCEIVNSRQPDLVAIPVERGCDPSELLDATGAGVCR